MTAFLLEFTANILSLAGIAALAASFFTLHELVKHTRPANRHRRWYFAAGYLSVVLAACIGYAAVSFGHHLDGASLYAPAALCFGALLLRRTLQETRQAIDDTRRLAQREQDSTTDPGTGLHNRRYFERRLEEEVQRARRYRQPLSLLRIDIDRYTTIADTHGNHAGEALLEQIGALCQRTLRASDIAARLDTDELAVLAPGTPPAQALVLAERLRRMVEAEIKVLEYTSSGPLPLTATVSIGVAALGQSMEGPQAMLQAAGTGLQRAKSEGRNRVGLHLEAPAAARAPAGEAANTAALAA